MSEAQTDRRTQLFLGVDGGGSKTLAVLVDADGVERGRGLAGGSNYQAIGVTSAMASIHDAVQAARDAAASCLSPLSRVSAAWIGLAGVDRAEDVALLTPHLARLAGELRLTNDAELALSGLARGTGVALISGTGSIAIGRAPHGETARAGGWGHLMGDEGSGYEIGLSALRVVARSADGRGQPTVLRDHILAAWRLEAPEDLFTAVYGHPEKARIARLANLVIAGAREGDEVSRTIISNAVDELALAVETVVRRLALPPPIDLALGGGLLVHEEDFRALALERIQRELAVASVSIVEEPAAQAARWLAARSHPTRTAGVSG